MSKRGPKNKQAYKKVVPCDFYTEQWRIDKLGDKDQVRLISRSYIESLTGTLDEYEKELKTKTK
jgi:hypothetical protein